MSDKAKKILKIFSNSLIVIGVIILLFTYFDIIYSEVRYRVDGLLGVKYELETESIKIEDKKGSFSSARNIIIQPVNKDFSIVIESINVNSPIVVDVPIIDKDSYLQSLKYGVAHASFSDYPNDENARIYLFAHSSTNFWELGRYSSVFNLLNKLKIGNEVNIFYKGKRYVYQVEKLEYKKDFRVDETVYETIGPSLTLQTCHPPGTTNNRLIVTSSLIKIE